MGTEQFHRKEQENRSERREREQASKLDQFVERGEWMMLRGEEEFQELSPEGKISMAMKAVSVRIGQDEEIFFQLLPRHPKDAGVILEHSIKPMRSLKDALAGRLAREFQQENNMSDSVDFVLGIDKPNNNQSPVPDVVFKRAA